MFTVGLEAVFEVQKGQLTRAIWEFRGFTASRVVLLCCGLQSFRALQAPCPTAREAPCAHRIWGFPKIGAFL